MAQLNVKVIPTKWVYRDENLYNRLKALTIDSYSLFNSLLRQRVALGRVLLATEGKRLSEVSAIKGWALLYNEGSHYMTGVYVDPQYRRRGIGSLLVTRAREIASRVNKPVQAEPWDHASRSFFRKNQMSNNHWSLWYLY